MNHSRVLFALILLCNSLSTWALPGDRSQPITIKSDRAERDEKNGTTLYQGSVIMEQGSMRIEADRVIIHNAEKKVSLIVATGLPARYQQKVSVDKQPVIAKGNTIEYKIEGQALTLLGNASIEQEGSRLSGQRINYDLEQSLVTAGSDADAQPERIQMIIPPSALESTKEQEKDSTCSGDAC